VAQQGIAAVAVIVACLSENRMSSRSGIVALFAMCCLVTLPLAGGCGPARPGPGDGGDPTTGGDGGTDAGDPNDCTRQGNGCDDDQVCNTQTKRCEDPPGGAVGDICNGATEQDPQGSCANGLICSFVHTTRRQRGDGAAPACSKLCFEDAECGVNGDADNVCVQLGQEIGEDGETGFCQQGCGQDSLCTDSGAQCLGINNDGSQVQVCIGGCAVHGDCTYGSSCDASLNVCQPETCTNSTQCGAGRVCANVFGDQVCVDDCTATACPEPLVCDTTTKACKAPGGEYYQSCNEQNPCTESDAACILFAQGATAGICLQECTATQLCGGTPEGARCVVSTQSGDDFCILVCGAGTNVTCPAGTTCKPITGGSVCAP